MRDATRHPARIRARHGGGPAGCCRTTSRVPRLRTVLIDFDRLDERPDVFRASHVFCALGTTIKQAGSRERFRQVDFGYPLRVAELAKAAGARHFLLVSSVGASSASRGFYLRVKGDLEAAIVALGFPSVTVVRPSLLLGGRNGIPAGRRNCHAAVLGLSAQVSGSARAGCGARARECGGRGSARRARDRESRGHRAGTGALMDEVPLAWDVVVQTGTQVVRVNRRTR